MIKELITKLYIKLNPDMTCILKETLEHYEAIERDYLEFLQAEAMRQTKKHNVKKYIVAEFIPKELYELGGQDPNLEDRIKHRLATKFIDAIKSVMDFRKAGQDDIAIRYEASITLLEEGNIYE